MINEHTSDGFHTFKELYQHRNLLFLTFLYTRPSNSGNSWRSLLHHDGTGYDDWFIVGTELMMDNEAVQITYHLPIEMWKLCDFLPTRERALEWDGHTPNDVIERLTAFLMRHREGRKAPPVVLTKNPMQIFSEGRGLDR